MGREGKKRLANRREGDEAFCPGRENINDMGINEQERWTTYC